MTRFNHQPEINCLIVIVCIGLAFIVPPVVKHVRKHESEVAPVDSAAVGSGS